MRFHPPNRAIRAGTFPATPAHWAAQPKPHENHEPRMSNAKTRAVKKKHRKAQARMKQKVKEQLAKKKPEKKK